MTTIQMLTRSTTPTPEQQRRRDALRTLALPAGLAPRLAREQGWSPVFTEEVIAEYRRFLILATTSGQSVTPSRTVDHVWHAHLEYTHAYWDTLCQGLLGEPLHHTPGEPGDEAHYRQQYLDTLDLYQETFGEAAPLTCWPDPRRSSAEDAAARAARTRGLPTRRASLNRPATGREAGQTSSSALLTTLIVGLGSLAFGLNGGSALLSLMGGLICCGAVLLALNGSRRSPFGSDSGGDTTMFTLTGGDGGDSGSGGQDGSGDCETVAAEVVTAGPAAGAVAAAGVAVGADNLHGI
ncbi:hypothetical protein MF271_19610 (plasmid) [Deinococcus sp. KNUC1210]|uniref:glycine-rich domain-containing protein n=1 Tax=Deinococcus sp. KNUC1210 TaxID=2917691 RepID=UPI001EF0B3F0|nr:hypothetical protein [Deinococcus sp. KNUC1210]ULH17809.1 hypothetical protein MF271_19610 [Deinococcus sp. KNUC1210]